VFETKVKICGLFRPEDIEIVNALEDKPDYIGFVFAESKRKVTPQQALKLRTGGQGRPPLHPDIIPVGVFVNESPEFMQSLVKEGVIDVIQTPTHVGEYLIFDSPNPGSGKTFDWNTIPETGKPFFLAGGLNPENVAEAIKKTSPFAVDVSSGVETNGIKDAAKIKEFIRRARSVKHGN
jgi:phosphoribosylanthranilate isomerase